MTPRLLQRITLGMLILGGTAAQAAAQDKSASSAATPGAAPAKAPDALDLFFETGSSKIRKEDLKLLDKASRLYTEGKPVVMIVAGSTDLLGSASANLRLSQTRADNVVRGLVARGIPIERFQVLAKGVTDLPVSTAADVSEPRNRRVEITWR